MGICSSSTTTSPEERERQKQERIRSAAVERNMQEDNNVESMVNKLLLLGAGESGKSTLFKQMITIYGAGFPADERATFEPIIYNNVITAMQTLIMSTPQFGGQITASASADYISNLKGDEKVMQKEADAIAEVWKDPAVQTCYANRAKFQLTDSASYFFERIAEVGADDYLPSEQDVLRSRVRTTGIVENVFNIEGNQFKMFDVGGQRNERKKWIHCFEGVTAVLFVGVLSEYDQVLYEDENQNRMEETLALFHEIINSRWFRNTSIILFLNKRDMFQEKIKESPLSKSKVFEDRGEDFQNNAEKFPDGIDNYDDGCRAIRQLFEEKNQNPDTTIYTHITCATDTGNVRVVFDAVKDIIIRDSLSQAGLV